MKNIVLIILAIFLFTGLDAQFKRKKTIYNPPPTILYTKNKTEIPELYLDWIGFKDAVHIIEGEVIQVNEYVDDPNSPQIYENLIQVNKVFRGDIQQGQVINLVTAGWNFKGKVHLSKGTKGVFFCSDSALETSPNEDDNLSISLVLPENKFHIFFYSKNKNQNPVINKYIQFTSKKDFYDFLRQQENIIVPDTDYDPDFEQYIFENRGYGSGWKKDYILNELKSTTVTDTFEKRGRAWYHPDSPTLKRLEEKKKSTAYLKSAGNTNISFKFSNYRLSAESEVTRFFEFDILVNSNTESVYLYEASIQFQFNDKAFYEEVWTNGKIIYELSEAFEADYEFHQYGNIKKDEFFCGFWQTGMNRTLIPTSEYIPILHVKLEINKCDKKTKLKFLQDDDKTYFHAYYSTTETGDMPETIPEFDNIIFENELNVNTCEISISEITPTDLQVKAGTHDGRDILTITGNGFGDLLSPYTVNGNHVKGKVLFINAENPYATTPNNLVELNAEDFIWTNEMITINVPSIIKHGNDEFVPGSGKMKIINYMGDELETDDKIDIVYAISNRVVTNTTTGNIEKFKEYLVKSEGSSNTDITFVIHNSIDIHPDRNDLITCIEAALLAWSCELPINIALEYTGGVPVISNDPPSLHDEINSIYIDHTFNGAPLMQVETGSYRCNENNNYYRKQADIAIHDNNIPFVNNGIPDVAYWHYDITGTDIPAKHYDFYASFLHELGHVLLLEHVIDPEKGTTDINKEIMYYLQNMITNAPIPNSDRVDLESGRAYGGSYPSIEGAIDAVNSSINTPFTSCEGIINLEISETNICGGQIFVDLDELQINPGATYNIPYTTTQVFYSGNIFTAQLSDATGSFANPINIGSYTSIESGTITVSIPSDIAHATGYRIRITGSNPQTIGEENGEDLTIVNPNAQLLTSAISPTSLCGGTEIIVNYTFNNVSFNTNNIFTVQLSNESGSFSSPTIIGSQSGTGPGSISASLPINLTAGSGYRIRVLSSNPFIEGADNGTDLTINVAPKPSITVNGTTSFCEGSNTELVSNNAQGYLWYPGNETTKNITVTSSGDYTVEITDGNGCISEKSEPVSITVIPNQLASITISADNGNVICPRGGLSAFSAEMTNGGDNPQYQWNINGVNIGVSSPTITTTPLKVGDIVLCIATSSACVSNNPVESNHIEMLEYFEPSIEITSDPVYMCNPVIVEPVIWQTLKGDAVSDGNNIYINVGDGQGEGFSNQRISDGGFFECDIDIEGNSWGAIGLSDYDTECDDFRINFYSDGDCIISESCYNKMTISSPKHLKIEIKNYIVRYYFDNIHVYTSPKIANSSYYINTIITRRSNADCSIENINLRTNKNDYIFTANAENIDQTSYNWYINNDLIAQSVNPFLPFNIYPNDIVKCEVSSPYCDNKSVFDTYQIIEGMYYDISDYFLCNITSGNINLNARNIYADINNCNGIPITINTGITVNLTVSEQITLKKGFHAKRGSNFNGKYYSIFCEDNSKSYYYDRRIEDPYSSQECELQIKVYPNPNKGIFDVQIVGDYSKVLSLEIINITGTKMIKYSDINSNIINIHLNDYEKGIYIIKTQASDKIFFDKVIVE